MSTERNVTVNQRPDHAFDTGMLDGVTREFCDDASELLATCHMPGCTASSSCASLSRRMSRQQCSDCCMRVCAQSSSAVLMEFPLPEAWI